MTVLLLVTGACFASLAGAAAAADLAVTVDGPASATAGASVAYQVAVTNNGVDDATTVQLTDATPANTTFVSLVQDTGPAFMCTSPGLGGTGDSTCAIATLVPGASATFTLTVHIDNAVSGGTFITDVATTTADNDDNSENDQGSAATQVTPVTLADLQAVVTGPDGAARFSDVTYRISVTNSGPDAAPATLTDDVPSGTSFVSLTQTTGPGFTCTTPPIGNG
ncbi:MAG: hypothetical protein QOI80_2285, partial [Solirubrobacteraceae bacterium]|nr:hypothetical protein [Solirubrobacteraceae bacterium]